MSYENSDNVNEYNVEKWLQGDACELGFQDMTDTDIANAAVKQKGKEKGGEKWEWSSECMSHSIALQCADTTRLHVPQRN